MNNTTFTVHYCLAGTYRGKGKELKALLTHASLDEGTTPLCTKVKQDSLCDVQESEPVTCPSCLTKLKKMGL